MMRFLLALALLEAMAGGCNFQTGPLPPIDVYFSPKGGATEAVVRALNAAQQTVFVQAYSFTSKPIAEALIHARQRGVVVHVILDKSNVTENYSDADFIAHHDIPVLIDAKHPIAHNKIMIIDRQTVITGSFNFTRQAEEQNAENLLVIHDQGMAERYLENWHDHEVHSEPYSGRGEQAPRPRNEREHHAKKKLGVLED